MPPVSVNSFTLGAVLFLAGTWVAPRSLAAMPGQATYEAQCAACHQPDGAGAAGLAPPLRDHLAHYLSTEAGRAYLAQILISGMVGPITVDGVPFSGLMPSFAMLDDDTLAKTINYVLVAMNGVGPAITPQSIAAARANRLTPVATRKLRSIIIMSGN